MEIILFIAVGLIVGFTGVHAVPWRRSEQAGWSMIVGILGAFGGALVGRMIGYAGSSPPMFVISVLGAVTTSASYLAVKGRKTV
jgi:uncharacterized membrane protein YeaQ/YmgE (transglycosylase-associated protein family)